MIGLASGADSAAAGTKPFATGLMIYNSSVNVVTSCNITNVGKKPVTVASVLIANQGGGIAATFDGCTTAPLAPGAACLFSGDSGSVQGGGIVQVKGNTSNLRGNCSLLDPGGTAVQFAPLR
jgi:hypothetical protein